MALEVSYVGPVMEYSPEIAAGIGRLMPQLDPNFSGEPITATQLSEQIVSPYHDELVVVQNKIEVIGAAAMSVIIGSGVHVEKGWNRVAWLEDFVTDEAVRGQRTNDGSTAASLLYIAMLKWGREKQCNVLDFHTEPEREAAIKFYKKMGVRILDNSLHLSVEIPEAA